MKRRTRRLPSEYPANQAAARQNVADILGDMVADGECTEKQAREWLDSYSNKILYCWDREHLGFVN